MTLKKPKSLILTAKGGSMIRIILVFAAAILFACNSTDSDVPEKIISAGVYENDAWKTDEELFRVQLEFASNGTFARKSYDPGQCLACESMGKWKDGAESVLVYDAKSRCRSGLGLCEDPMEDYAPAPNETVKIRSATDTSFEAWIPGTESKPGYWVEWVKL